MNIDDYIASGILESYVLGMSSAQENALIECLIRTNPVVAEEVHAIRETFERSALEGKMEPPADLKKRIWSRLAAESIQSPQQETKLPDPEAGIIPLKTGAKEQARENRSRLGVAASLTLFLASSALAFYFYTQNKEMNTRLARLESGSQKREEAMRVKEEYLEFLADKETEKITLAGVPGMSDAKATVFWNKKNKHVMLSDVALPKAPENMQYQLWAIAGGKPVDAGTLDVDHEGRLLEMKPVGNSQAFAITLEPMGGSPVPHLEELCVIGNISTH